MPVLPQFDPQGRPGEAADAFSSGMNDAQSWMNQAQNRQIRAQDADQKKILFDMARPLIEARTAADIEKSKVDYDGFLRTQENRKKAYALYSDAQNDFDYLNLIPDDKQRAAASREWLSRYSQLANVAELKEEMSVKNHLATSNVLDSIKIATLGSAEARAFEALTQGMTPEEKDKAKKVKMGLEGRASNAGMKSTKVKLPDGSEADMVFDPRSGEYSIPTINAPKRAVNAGAMAENPFIGQSTADESRDKESAKLAEERKMELIKTRPKRTASLQQAEKLTVRLGGDIDELVAKVTAATAGPGGVLLDKFPGTSARDLQSNLDSIKANIGFQTLQAMREASPTGGALGQVSDVENKLLQSVLGSLQIGQSPAQLVANLKKVKQRVTENYGITRAAFTNEFGEAPAPAPGAWDETKETRLQELKAKLGK